MNNSISSLISPEALPAICPETDSLKHLANALAQSVRSITPDSIEFAFRAVKTLAVYGDCTGLAYIPPGSQEMILCAYLRREITLSAEQNPSLQNAMALAIEAINRFQETLRRLSALDGWPFLSAQPDPTRNRLIHFQASIMAAPAYALVAARLHRGICAKIFQIKDLPSGHFDEILRGATRYLDRIVLNIPVEQIKGSLAEYRSGEFDTIIWNVIRGLPKKRITTGGSSFYADATLATIEDAWIAAFYAGAAGKAFIKHTHRAIPTGLANLSTANPEKYSAVHPVWKPFMDQVAAQRQMERAEILGDEQRRQRRQTRLSISDEGRAVVAFNPSPNSQGALSIVTLALITTALDELRSEWTELNYWGASALVNSMLHLGRRPEWLINIQMTENPPVSHSDCSQPMYVLSEGAVYYIPTIYIGLPARLNPLAATPEEQVQAEWHKHNENYEQNSLIYKIRLPDPIAAIYHTYADVRAAILKRWPLEASGLRCSAQSGPLWLWDNLGQFMVVNMPVVKQVLETLTQQVRYEIPRHPAITPANLTRTFEGWYAHLRLRGEYRYYTSELTRSDCEMPLRYSLVDSEKIYRAHNSVCVEFRGHIERERACIINGGAQ